MSFDDAAVRNLFSQVVSHAASLGLFERVCSHEPKNAPGNGLSCSIWVQSIKLAGRASGLNMVSGVVTLSIRVMSNMLREPQDDTDRLILTAVSVLMKEYSGNFTLGGAARQVDLLGQVSNGLEANAGYLTQDQRMYRVMVVTLPVIINDLWSEVA